MRKNYTLKTTRCWCKKSKMTWTDGKTYSVLELEDSVLSKWLYWPKAVYRFTAILIKLPKAFFSELEQKILNFYGNTKDPQIAKEILIKEQSWRYHAPWLQSILQSHSHQNRMILAQNQKQRSMEQNRDPRNKPTHL